MTPEEQNLHEQALAYAAPARRIKRFSDLFYRHYQLVERVQGGEASAEELFEGFEAKQAAWFIQQSDELIERLQAWRAAVYRKHPQLKTRGLRGV